MLWRARHYLDADLAEAGLPLMLKWPNDLMLAGDKLAGILLERNGNRIVVGFGVNLAYAPKLPDRVAASLGGKMGTKDFAPLLAATFAKRLDQWRTGTTDTLRSDWLARAHPVGTPLSVHGVGADRVSGTFAGLEPDGALKLQTSAGIEIVRAGDVTLA